MIASFILTFRSTDDFDNELISTLYKTLEDIQILYCDTNVIDKEIAYGRFVLHDNLRGAILSWTNEDKTLISEISSRIDRYIEKIFLS